MKTGLSLNLDHYLNWLTKNSVGWTRISQSLRVKLAVLLLIFLSVPIILYVQFQISDAEKTDLLEKSVREEGRLIALGLAPALRQFDGKSHEALTTAVGRFGGERVNIKLLFRPKAPKVTGVGAHFFYMASSQAVSNDYLEQERKELEETGILAALGETCEGNLPRTLGYTNPEGQPEVITSMVPVNVTAGCWVVIASHATSAFLDFAPGRPFWKSPDFHLAASIYILAAIVVISLLVDSWRGLRLFQRTARQIGNRDADDLSFSALNRIPELSQAASEFDHMVKSLKTSEDMIRQAAEENAHALKAPLAVISQSLEPLDKSLPAEDQRGHRAIELIKWSVSRLDMLVSAARRMDEAIAELINLPRHRLDLSALVVQLSDAYATALKENKISVEADVEQGLEIIADAGLIETALENVIDNARSFSPAPGRITIRLHSTDGAGGAESLAELIVEDQGPGLMQQNAEQIFERYFSDRPVGNEPVGEDKDGGFQSAITEATNDANATNDGEAGHSGIGLSVARRNIEAFGGTVTAGNAVDGGLRVTITLPLAG